MKRAVVWISGPAGSGKTTLVASYLEEKKLPCLWYQVDEGDADPSTFFYYMGLAAKKAAPRRKLLPLLTPEYLPGLYVFTLRYFEMLFGYLKPPAVIVFDNGERVPEDAPFFEILRSGISVIPQGITVIINSRRQFPLRFSALQSCEKIDCLTWQDIRFTLDESGEMIRIKGHRIFTQEVVEQIHEKTEGWAAGLILMIEAARIKGIDLTSVKRMTLEEVYNYFETELFDQTDHNTQNFLLKTAFLPEMTVDVATKLSDMTESRHILQFLNRSNFFIQSHSLDSPVYQYHALFREYLITRAKKIFSEGELSLIKRNAAHLLAESGHYEEAAALFLEDNAWTEIIHLILSQANTLIAQGRFTTLYGWLMDLPLELREKNPWLLFWMGASRLPFDPQASEAYFARSFEMFVAEQDPAGILLAWSGVVNAIMFRQDDFSRLDSWIGMFGGLRPLYDIFPVPEIKARMAASMLSALAVRQPQHPDLGAWADEVLNFSDDQIDVNIKIQALSYYIINRIFMGKFREAMVSLSLLRQLIQGSNASSLSRTIGCWVDAMCSQFYGLHDECLRVVNMGLTLAGLHGIDFTKRALLGHAASTFLNRGDLSSARNFIRKMDTVPKAPDPWDDAFYYNIKSREAMIEGNLADALHYGRLALAHNSKVGTPVLIGTSHANCAQAACVPGQESEAEYHLREAYKIAEQTKSTGIRFFTLYVHARLALAWKDMSLCLSKLREALSLGKDERYLITLFDDPSVTAQLCAIALEHDIEVEYVKEIIRRRGLVLYPPPFHIDQWPWQFRIYTMGRFELHHHDGPVPFTRKTQKKPLELLKVLVASGGKKVNDEQIADLLWPESDGDAAYAAFKTNLSRLRHLLGNDEVIRFQDGKVTIDPHLCWVDAWAFEHMAVEAEKGWKQDLSEKLTFVEKAINLYKGHFLSSDGDTFPVVAYREHLRDVYLRLVARVGDYHKKASQWEEALTCFAKGIEVDPLVEEFYQQMMVCYEKLGQRTRAIETYQRCKKILASTLGCDPSSKTQALYRSLRTG